MIEAVRFCYGCNDRYAVDASVRTCPVCRQLLSVVPLGSTHEVLHRETRFDASGENLLGDENLVGRTIAGYQIESFVGRGGMARVYKANHVTLMRPCALKVLSPRLAARDPRFVPLFLAEARSAAALVHPHVVTVHNIGRDGDYHFIEMEYVAGQSLRAILSDSKAVDVATATNYVCQICSALAEAHRLGIVHRDIKPANVLVTGTGSAKLADFGLAKRVLASGQTLGDRGVAGTPHFMAPELFRAEAATASSDVYAVGVTLYFLLTGQLPYVRPTVEEVAEAHQSDPVPDVSAEIPAVPEELSQLVRACMSKDPARRYPHAGALWEELRSVRGHLRDMDAFVTEVLSALQLSWTRKNGCYETVVSLPEGRSQSVRIDLSPGEPLAARLVRIYSVCAPLHEGYFRRALELNADLPHGSIAVQTIDGRPHFVMVDTYPQATCDAEELRRSVLTVARWSDDVERALTQNDRF